MNYATIKNFDIANGEGVRVSLFVSGCRHHCVGCFNSIAWDFEYGEPFTDDVEKKLLEMLENENIRGLSLLGGEPFEPENQRGLIDFIRKYKALLPNKDLWCYTGFLFDSDLKHGGKAYTEVTDELLSYIDVLVDGKFMIDLKDISIKFRGSRNQRIIDVKKSIKENKVVLREDLMTK
ncbi:MAG: anaerobic ribonucleoside-triphosphate reductase activating protein [Anaeroplasmataceae bacterium]